MPETLDRLRSALADRYTIERPLGRGGMAIVYLARDLKHERQVAIKILRPELTETLGVARFLREVTIAANLAHPHIVPLFDSGEADGFLYYVMPYVEGESLRERLNSEKQLSIDDSLRIVREVADALSYAHSHGVVHRDIKPENILLESGHAVVADFGIARAITVAGGERLTGTGVSLGTPAYMSPEQGHGHVDGRSDIYSLGCVLYEMLTGEPPFTGATGQAVIARHTQEAPRSLTVVRPTVPPSVEFAVQAALAKVPADRPSTAEQFVELFGTPVPN
ncbi:MAG: serine/threonine protein kinase, partial [Gemmatimonadetes bacterium]|nr:serine/threonine protein kinase [Gemmatimonadota bacterium]